MAEERLIDTDKDKKYTIRKNADGEDELYIEDADVEEETEEVTFMVGDETEEIQEDYADQYTIAEEERAQKAEEALKYIQSARSDCEEGKFATAADYLEKAMELDRENGEIYALELVAYTRNFTDYSRIKDVLEYVDELELYTSKQTKDELLAKAEDGLKENISSLSQTVEKLNQENEEKKAIRAKRFVADRNRTAIIMSVVFAIFAVLASLSVYCFLNIHSVQTNTFLVAAIVLTAVAAIALIFSGIILSRLLTACRRVRLNKSNNATELGRNLIAMQADLDAFTAIYEALKG